MEKSYILTYDIGTTGNKCTVFNSLGQEVVATTVPYGTIYPKPGWSEQDPIEFWQSVVTGTRELIDKFELQPKDVAVIGISGHMNGCIPMDAKGNVLYNNIIHSDCRTQSQCNFIQENIDFDSFYKITGNRIDPHYTLPKVLWLKENYPELYQQTRFFINTKDYISYCLTGNLGITDYSDASLTCMLDLSKRDWANDMLKYLGLDSGKLPSLHSSNEIAGGLSKEAAELLGLIPGIPVTVGGGDGACATRGSGVKNPGDSYNYFGSSSWIANLSDSPILDKDARIFNYFDLDGKHMLVCGTVQSAAASYNWAMDMLGRYNNNISTSGESHNYQVGRDPQDLYDKMEALARSAPIGSNGLFFLPYLMGERTPLWDPNTRGAFIGFTLYHTRSDMVRSVYEGVAYALRTVLDVFMENQANIRDVILIGGGAKSKLWNEMLCNI
ncbi:MAG: xylulokinase, partial [Clostridiales bacterium]|nr:xylulokinase [Clostridiales bacterium]